ncbi:MAG: phosphomannomutase/phosphoglucomutase [Candidatus Micrarchaeia archaeon]|jgi:phosphomannomutase/phosphoglucomutase
MSFSIFGGYDVRGIYPDEINEKAALKIGSAFGALLVQRGIATCIVGRDNRESSEGIAKAFTEGLTDYAGINVIDIGLAPTSTMCFALMNNMQMAGASITASHNPIQYNGIKFYGRKVLPLFSEDLLKVRKCYESEDEPEKAAVKGKVTRASYNDRHAEYAASKHKPARRMKAVIDCGNSVCSLVALKMFKLMGIEAVELFCDLDGRFPNHLPDPHKRDNYAAISQKVRDVGADFGVMFDGDGDRAGFVDEQGSIVDGDFAHILLIRDLLSKKPEATAVLDLRLSLAVFEDAQSHGAKVAMSKAGRMAIHEEMDRLGADYGGEVTGHISFAENAGNDDAFYATAKMAQILSNSQDSFSTIVSGLPQYHSLPEMRIPCENERKFHIVEEVKKAMWKSYKVNAIDGVRVDFEDSWGLLRVSNTEPQITLRFEGKTQASLEKVYAIFSEELKRNGVELPALK